jgi:hypothetical protein
MAEVDISCNGRELNLGHVLDGLYLLNLVDDAVCTFILSRFNYRTESSGNLWKPIGCCDSRSRCGLFTDSN